MQGTEEAWGWGVAHPWLCPEGVWMTVTTPCDDSIGCRGGGEGDLGDSHVGKLGISLVKQKGVRKPG